MVKPAPKRGSLKRQKSNNRISSRTRLGLTALSFLAILIVCGKMLNLVLGFSQPYAPDSPGFSKYYNWEGKGRINVVVQADNLYLLSLDSGIQSVTLLLIPEETYLNLPRGFGNYPARSVYQLGQNERPLLGAQLLKEGVSNTLAVPVDGYLIIGEKYLDRPFVKVIDNLRQNPLQAFGLLNDSKTDLSLKEYISLVSALRDIRADKVTEEDLGQSNLTSWKLLPSGSRVLGINQLSMAQYAEENLVDSGFSSEELSIGIYNATDHPQLAEKAARIVGNLGGKVIFTTNLPVKAVDSMVFGKKSYTASRLRQIFTIRCRGEQSGHSTNGENCQLAGFNLESSRADINLIVGEDYYQKQSK